MDFLATPSSQLTMRPPAHDRPAVSPSHLSPTVPTPRVCSPLRDCWPPTPNDTRGYPLFLHPSPTLCFGGRGQHREAHQKRCDYQCREGCCSMGEDVRSSRGDLLAAPPANTRTTHTRAAVNRNHDEDSPWIDTRHTHICPRARFAPLTIFCFPFPHHTHDDEQKNL